MTRAGRAGRRPGHRLRRHRHRAGDRTPGLARHGTDASPDALDGGARATASAWRAAASNGRCGDWYAPLAGRRFDALVSNPPYIAADDPVLAGDGLRHEPRGALTPGGDGIRARSPLLLMGPRGICMPGGWLVLEHGATQGETLRALLVARGFTHVTSHRDLAGHERVTEGKLAP